MSCVDGRGARASDDSRVRLLVGCVECFVGLPQPQALAATKAAMCRSTEIVLMSIVFAVSSSAGRTSSKLIIKSPSKNFKK